MENPEPTETEQELAGQSGTRKKRTCAASTPTTTTCRPRTIVEGRPPPLRARRLAPLEASGRRARADATRSSRPTCRAGATTPLPTEPFSFVEFVAALLPAALVGNSFGGAVALRTALAHPDRVSSARAGRLGPPRLGLDRGDARATSRPRRRRSKRATSTRRPRSTSSSGSSRSTATRCAPSSGARSSCRQRTRSPRCIWPELPPLSSLECRRSSIVGERRQGRLPRDRAAPRRGDPGRRPRRRPGRRPPRRARPARRAERAPARVPRGSRPSGPPQDRVGQARPRVGGPVAEGEIGEAAERDARLRVDPEERAAAAEVAERARRVARAGPVRRLARRAARGRAPSRSAPAARTPAARRRARGTAPRAPRRASPARCRCGRLQLAREREQVAERALDAGAGRALEHASPVPCHT